MRSRSYKTAVGLALVMALVFSVPMAFAADADAPLVLHAIETDSFPVVHVGVTLPAGIVSAGETPLFEVRENGLPLSDVTAEAVGVSREPIDVVLLVDASGSMAGEPIADARSAAKRFIATMADGDRIAVLTFGERVETLAKFNSDRAALGSAVEAIEVRGETALYDGLLAAVDLAGESEKGASYIVVLSDGGDTVSVADLNDAAKAATAARIPVYAVTLESPEYDPAPLNTIAKESGGKLLSVSDTAALESLLEGIALELSSRYTITYESSRPATADLDLVFTATGSGGVATAETVLENPSLAVTGVFEPFVGLVFPQEMSLASRFAFAGAVAMVFLAVGLLVFGVLTMVLPEPNVLNQLRYYEQMHTAGDPDAALAEAREDTEAQGRLRDAVSFVAGRRGFTRALHRQLERAGLPLRPVEYMYFHILGVTVLSVAAQLITGRLMVTLLVVAATVFLPIAFLDLKVSLRSRAFEEQLPDILSLIAGSLRAGWGVQQSIDLVVQEAADPARSEFRRVQSEVRLGLPLEEGLARMAERVDSDDFRWTVAAITIQREVGGNLAEVLDIVSGTIRERADLRREVKALTAEGRLSAIILTALPFVMFVAMVLINPEYMGRMLSTSIGVIILLGGLALLVIGVFWINSTTKIEV